MTKGQEIAREHAVAADHGLRPSEQELAADIDKAIAAEREACAKLVEAVSEDDTAWDYRDFFAKAIRDGKWEPSPV